VARLNGSEIRPGMVIEHLGSLWVAVKTMAVKPGKGPAYNQVELKNLIDGRKLNHRFGADERVEETYLERRNFQFLYRQGESLVFMDTDNYEQIELADDFVGERAAFLQDGMTVSVSLHAGRPIGVRLPEHVVLKVTEAMRSSKGRPPPPPTSPRGWRTGCA
jgi:elongation factor P